MSGDVQLREIDRGANGKLRAVLRREPKKFVLFEHMNPDGTKGGRLVVQIDEIPVMLDVLRSAQHLANAKPAQHRTVRATVEELETDRKLF